MLLIVSATPLSPGFYREVLFEIAVRDGGNNLHDSAHLLGEIRRHDIDGISKIFPRASDS